MGRKREIITIDLSYPKDVETETIAVSSIQRVVFAKEPFTPRENWWQQASCFGVGQEKFVTPNTNSRAWIQIAKEYCIHCPVSADCLEEALVMGDRGLVRGGLTDRNRDKLRLHRQRNRRANTSPKST